MTESSISYYLLLYPERSCTRDQALIDLTIDNIDPVKLINFTTTNNIERIDESRLTVETLTYKIFPDSELPSSSPLEVPEVIKKKFPEQMPQTYIEDNGTSIHIGIACHNLNRLVNLILIDKTLGMSVPTGKQVWEFLTTPDDNEPCLHFG